jgi:hypothetical protein
VFARGRTLLPANNLAGERASCVYAGTWCQHRKHASQKNRPRWDRCFTLEYWVDGKQGSARFGKECSSTVSMDDYLALVSLPEIRSGHVGDLAGASLP